MIPEIESDELPPRLDVHTVLTISDSGLYRYYHGESTVKRPSLTLDLLTDFLYDPETGIVSRISTGKSSWALSGDGYYVVRVNKTLHYIHRIAWTLGTQQEIPAGMVIDHVDRNRGNNALRNLRLATRAQNKINTDFKPQKSSDLPRGVFASGKGYVAHIGHRYLGFFPSVSEATEAFNCAAKERWGDFYNPEDLNGTLREITLSQQAPLRTV